jgi:hypothetical protein
MLVKPLVTALFAALNCKTIHDVSQGSWYSFPGSTGKYMDLRCYLRLVAQLRKQRFEEIS